MTSAQPLPDDEKSIPVRTGRIVGLLWRITWVLYAACFVRQVYVLAFGDRTALGNLRLLNLGGELTIPAWYTSMLLLAAAGLLATHAIVARRQKRPNGHWWALSAIFVLLSVDETSSIHELLQDVLPYEFTGFLAFNWVVLATPILLVVGLAFVPFLWRLPRPYAFRIVIAGLVYVGGAYGMEMVGAYIATTSANAIQYFMTVSIEEGMEMAGACLLISTLLSLLAREAPELTLRIG